jgi:hypothetical protein
MNSKFKINNIYILSTSCHKLNNNTDCTICRSNLNLASIYALEKGTESIILQGLCGHSFHKECITPWIKQNKHCPICCKNWLKT